MSQAPPNVSVTSPQFYCVDCGAALMRLMKLSDVAMSQALFPWWCGYCHGVFALPYWVRHDFTPASSLQAYENITP